VRKLKKPVLGGAPPFGYRKIGIKKDARLEIEDEEAWIIREIFELYTNGNSSKGPMSLKGIAIHFNNSGILPTKKRKDSADYWSPHRIRRILKNELYSGVYIWGKTRSVRKGYQQKGIVTKQPQENWIRLDVPELAIVDKETFDLAQIRIERNKRLSKRNRKYKYLMTGFIRCGECGCTIVGHAMKKRRRKIHLMYRCGSLYKTYKGDACKYVNCRTVTHKIDNAVWHWLISLLLDKEKLELGLNELLNERSQSALPKKRKLESVCRLIEETEKSIRQLVHEMANHGSNVVISAFRNEIQIATKRLDAASEERDILRKELEQIELTNNQKDQILTFADSIHDLIEKASYENKRRILDILDVQAILHYGEDEKWLEVKCAIPTSNATIELHPSTCWLTVHH
jgi:site-specific DNA recombinase